MEENGLKKEKREVVFYQKLLYTIFTILVYLVGRSIPVYGVDTAAYQQVEIDAQGLLTQTISGDQNRYSIFALGISPIMISSILSQLVLAFRSSDAKAKMSPKKNKLIILSFAFLIALVQAFMRSRELIFLVMPEPEIIVRLIAGLEMVVGVMLIIWLSHRNQRYGIGGQTALIFVNIIDGILRNVFSSHSSSLLLPLLISLAVLCVMAIMENTEKRIPLQRISIHNIYADKNYLAIKLNPIGVMPAMFSTAVFMLPQLVIAILHSQFPQNATLVRLKEQMTLNQPFGIIVYIVILYLLTLIFSRVFVNPTELTEQFLKSGDSIVNIHAGKDTKRYLSKTIFQMSLVSATVMAVCLALPMFIQLRGVMEGSLVMLPSSVMMLTGIWCNLYREAQSIRDYDSYKALI